MSVKEKKPRELEAASELAYGDGAGARAEMPGEDAHSLRKGLVPAGGWNGRVPDDLPYNDDVDGPVCGTCGDTHEVQEPVYDGPESAANYQGVREADCPDCGPKRAWVVYIDRQGEERSETMRAELARDFTDRKGLRECHECSKLCLPVLYEDYEDGHTEHTCYLCDFADQLRDLMRLDFTGKSKAEIAAACIRSEESYYEAVGPVREVRKVWS